MKVRCSEEALPHNWSAAYPNGDLILFERDIRLSSLYLKLLVFPNVKALRRFWVRTDPTKVGGPLGDALGAVSSLQCEFRDYSKSQWPEPVMEVDRRYFAAMGLVRGHLGMTVLTHECVHAAYAYAKRTGTKSPWSDAVGGSDGLDEELVCYPAGALAGLVVTVLNKAGMFKDNYISLGGI